MFFPFTAIVGQEDMKLGLILNVIDPSIGGLLISGEKGTAKSTTVRALANLLPDIETIKGCMFNCDPRSDNLCSFCASTKENGEELEIEKKKMEVVELPLGVTEDRVVGTLDVEYAIKYGKKRFEPGILAQANRNFLYVDEVNLLEDHIVDLLLDAAAMGKNFIEREGISFTHPARFILVGTMNPEEGDLRPQLLDRFGLCVQVSSIKDKKQRMEILRRRDEFDKNPLDFLRRWQEEESMLCKRIEDAKKRIDQIEIPEEILDKIVSITAALEIDGHRADIVLFKAAKALAAFRGEDKVKKDHIKKVAGMCIGHRLRRRPFEEIEDQKNKVQEILLNVV